MKRLISPFALCLAVCGGLILIASCNKEDPYDLKTPEPLVHFVGAKLQAYTMTSAATPPYVIKVGTTDVSTSNRGVTYKIVSPTGAVAGTHYTITGGPTVTIPAGQATADITIQGTYSQYTAGRKDTLMFTLVAPEIAPAGFSDSVILVMRGPCFEGDILTGLASLGGTYAQTRENGYNANGSAGYTNYGPYTSVVQNLTMTSPTTATFRATRIYDITGWDANFTMDWSNLADRKITTTSQILGNGAVIGLGAYNISVEPPINPNVPPLYGTFTFCSQTITLKFMLGAYNATTGVFAGYLTASSGGGAGTFTMVLNR